MFAHASRFEHEAYQYDVGLLECLAHLLDEQTSRGVKGFSR